MVFLSLKHNGNIKVPSNNRKYLAIGLLSLSVVLIIGTLGLQISSAGVWFYLGTILRLIYTVSFTKYAWCLRIRPPPAEPAEETESILC